MDDKCWYVIRSKPRKEEFLQQQLHLRQLEVYFPSLPVQPVNPRSRKRVPYFPGYLFIRVDLKDTEARTLNRIPGSIGLVQFGDRVPCVSDKILNAIQETIAAIGDNGIERLPEHHKGDLVKINNGPMEGYTAIFDTHLQGHERVKVLLVLMSDRKVAIEIDNDMIE